MEAGAAWRRPVGLLLLVLFPPGACTMPSTCVCFLYLDSHGGTSDYPYSPLMNDSAAFAVTSMPPPPNLHRLPKPASVATPPWEQVLDQHARIHIRLRFSQAAIQSVGRLGRQGKSFLLHGRGQAGIEAMLALLVSLAHSNCHAPVVERPSNTSLERPPMQAQSQPVWSKTSGCHNLHVWHH